MANLLVIDADGATQEIREGGDGSSGDPFTPQVGNPGDLINVTLSADTGIMASGDVIADTQVITDAMGTDGGRGVLESLVLVDPDDQGAALDLYLLDSNHTVGTENSAPGISDANALTLLGFIPIATGDYKDLGGVRVVCLRNLGLRLKAVGGSRDLYIAAVNGSGTPTYPGGSILVRLGIRWD